MACVMSVVIANVRTTLIAALYLTRATLSKPMRKAIRTGKPIATHL